MKSNVTKAKKTASEAAVQAAKELLMREDQKVITAASDKLTKFIQSWEAETGCTFIPAHQIVNGNQIETTLRVIKKQP